MRRVVQVADSFRLVSASIIIQLCRSGAERNIVVHQMSKARRVAEIAQAVALDLHVFEPRGQGLGNRVTNEAMRDINRQVEREFGASVVEVALVDSSKQTVDFYFEDEATIVEIEFGLSNPYPCLEKDAFKAIIARDAGKKVEKLVFIGDPGSEKRLAAAAPRTIAGWLAKHRGIAIEVIELRREPSPSPEPTCVTVTLPSELAPAPVLQSSGILETQTFTAPLT